MEDREVGNLWREATALQMTPVFDGGCVKKVICKLVEERSRVHHRDFVMGFRESDSDPTTDALRDFGIDHADYLKAKDSE